MLLFGVLAGVFSYVWTRHLVQPDNIFDFFPGLVRLVLTGTAKSVGLDELPSWKRKIMFAAYYCAKCNAGQVAFWSYLYFFWGYYDMFSHFLIVLTAIFTAIVLTHFLKYD